MMVITLFVAFMATIHNTNSQYNNFDSSFSSINNGNGNNIIISRRLGPNQVTEEYISVSVPKVIIDGDYVYCSTIVCPKKTFKCVVTSEASSDDKNKMKTVAECLDENENILDKTEYFENNPFPQSLPPFSRNSIVDRNGVVNIEDSNGQNVFNSKKLSEEEHGQMMNQINEETRRIQQQQKQFELQMLKFQEDMQQTFGNGFPFGNRGFPFAQNFPFYQPTFPSYNSPFYHAYPYYAPAQFTPYAHNTRYAQQPYENSHVDTN